jgi:hypothetical protein
MVLLHAVDVYGAQITAKGPLASTVIVSRYHFGAHLGLFGARTFLSAATLERLRDLSFSNAVLAHRIAAGQDVRAPVLQRERPRKNLQCGPQQSGEALGLDVGVSHGTIQAALLLGCWTFREDPAALL